MKDHSIWKYITNYKTNSIIIKHFFSILLIIILPMSLLFGSVYLNFTEKTKADYSEVYKQRLSNIANSLDNVYTQTRLFTYSLAGSPQVIAFMQQRESQELYQEADFSQIIGNSYLAYKNIESIYLYSDVNRYVLSGGRNDTIENFSDKSWLKKFSILQKNEIAVNPRKIDNTYPYCLSFTIGVFNDLGEKIGAVVVNINAESLLRTVAGDELSYYEIFAMDEYKRLVLSNDMERMFSQSNQYAYVYDRIAYANRHENDTLLYMLKSQESGLEYVFIAHNATQASPVQSFLLIAAFILFMLLTTLLVSILLAIRTFRPIRNIIETIGPEFDQKNQNGVRDEVSFIIENINKTIQDKRLVELEFEDRMVLLNQAYTAALQAQINPHFLYNTLETINYMAYKALHGRNDISTITVSLSKMLRIGLDNENKIVPLRTEFEHLSLYIKIIPLRYPDKCEFKFNIAEDLMDCYVVKLMLQPLVENAFQHGIRPKGEKGTIEISAFPQDDTLIFHITDDGVGMDEETLRSVRSILSSDLYLTSKHIGINNVNMRIKMLFGNTYGLRVTSTLGVGTTFTIQIPLSRQEPPHKEEL